MARYEAFTGLPAEVDGARIRRWTSLLVTAVVAILVIGVIVSAILWPTVSADAGALTICIAFAASTGLMVIRQALLAERRQDHA